MTQVVPGLSFRGIIQTTASEDGVRKLDYLVKMLYQVISDIAKVPDRKMDTLSLMSQWRRWTRRLKGRVELNIEHARLAQMSFRAGLEGSCMINAVSYLETRTPYAA
jgi:hypothetical protein